MYERCVIELINKSFVQTFLTTIIIRYMCQNMHICMENVWFTFTQLESSSLHTLFMTDSNTLRFFFFCLCTQYLHEV